MGPLGLALLCRSWEDVIKGGASTGYVGEMLRTDLKNGDAFLKMELVHASTNKGHGHIILTVILFLFVGCEILENPRRLSRVRRVRKFRLC